MTFCRDENAACACLGPLCRVHICCYTCLRRTLTTRFVAEAVFVGLDLCRSKQYPRRLNGRWGQLLRWHVRSECVLVCCFFWACQLDLCRPPAELRHCFRHTRTALTATIWNWEVIAAPACRFCDGTAASNTSNSSNLPACRLTTQGSKVVFL